MEHNFVVGLEEHLALIVELDERLELKLVELEEHLALIVELDERLEQKLSFA